jgi:hypothetical protein
MFRKRDRPKLGGGLKCAWCGDEIPDDTELFGIGAKARPDLDITELEGKVIDIFLTPERSKRAGAGSSQRFAGKERR